MICSNIGILEISGVPYLSNRVVDFENTVSLCCLLGCVAPKTNYNTDPRTKSAVTFRPRSHKADQGDSSPASDCFLCPSFDYDGLLTQ